MTNASRKHKVDNYLLWEDVVDDCSKFHFILGLMEAYFLEQIGDLREPCRCPMTRCSMEFSTAYEMIQHVKECEEFHREDTYCECCEKGCKISSMNKSRSAWKKGWITMARCVPSTTMSRSSKPVCYEPSLGCEQLKIRSRIDSTAFENPTRLASHQEESERQTILPQDDATASLTLGTKIYERTDLNYGESPALTLFTINNNIGDPNVTTHQWLGSEEVVESRNEGSFPHDEVITDLSGVGDCFDLNYDQCHSSIDLQLTDHFLVLATANYIKGTTGICTPPYLDTCNEAEGVLEAPSLSYPLSLTSTSFEPLVASPTAPKPSFYTSPADSPVLERAALLGANTNRERFKHKKRTLDEAPLGLERHDDDELSEKDRKKSVKTTNEEPYLACPFSKWNPTMYPQCTKYVLRRIKDVKQHLSRQHQNSHFYCTYCTRLVKSAGNIIGSTLKCPDCDGPVIKVWDGISTAQRSELTAYAGRGKTLAEQWYMIWNIIFPSEPQPESPFMESFQGDGISVLLDVWTKEQSRIITDVCGEDQRLADISLSVRKCVDMVFNLLRYEAYNISMSTMTGNSESYTESLGSSDTLSNMRIDN